MVEVAVYMPEVVPGAGKVLRAVVTRLPGSRNWFVQARIQRAWRGRSKRRALEFAVTEAVAVDSEARKGLAGSAPR